MSLAFWTAGGRLDGRIPPAFLPPCGGPEALRPVLAALENPAQLVVERRALLGSNRGADGARASQ